MVAATHRRQTAQRSNRAMVANRKCAITMQVIRSKCTLQHLVGVEDQQVGADTQAVVVDTAVVDMGEEGSTCLG